MVAPLRAHRGSGELCPVAGGDRSAAGRSANLARKLTLPIGELAARPDPFELTVDGASLSDRGMRGGFEDVAMGSPLDARSGLLRARSPAAAAGRGRADGARTAARGPIDRRKRDIAGRDARDLRRARRAGAHLGFQARPELGVGSLQRLPDSDGEPAPGALVDAVSVFVNRFGREVGPMTPVVGRIAGRAVPFDLADARAEERQHVRAHGMAVRGGRRCPEADRRSRRGPGAAGRSHLPRPGRRARLLLQQRDGVDASARLREGSAGGGWAHRETLVADGRAHFEYGQRTPIAELELLHRREAARAVLPLGRAHRDRRSPGAQALHDPPGWVLGGAVREPQPRPAHRRRSGGGPAEKPCSTPSSWGSGSPTAVRSMGRSWPRGALLAPDRCAGRAPRRPTARRPPPPACAGWC